MSKRDRQGNRHQRRYDDPMPARLTPYEDYRTNTRWGRMWYRIVWHVSWTLGGEKNMDPVKPWKSQ